MRLLIAFTIAMVLTGLSHQQCAIGCLRCNNQNQCLLCDITNGYQLSATTCRLNTQANCQILAQSGNCVVCANNFYMDINSQSCLAVGTANVIANCQLYNSAQACTSCSPNFWLSGGACVAVNVTVPNCQTYLSNGVCYNCNTGFVLSNDYTTCVAVPSNNNCLFYTYIGCRQCATGFVNNPNNYFTNFNSMSYVNTFLVNIISPTTQWVGLNVCQAVTVTNCAVYSTYNSCARCNPNFFLSSGACVAFPLNTIFGCSTYSSLLVCSSCQAGLYLSQNTCLPNGVLPNCAVYSTSSSTTTCLGCNNGFFLQGNSCANRTVSSNIANCQTASPIADLCGACQAGFALTSDNLACLPVISNCQAYSASTFQSSALQCSLCNNGFYLSSTGSSVSCISGTIASCLTYQVSQNVCTSCVNGFYLSNNVCLAHVNIPNCVTYDGFKQNFCSVCSTGYFNFAYTTVCVQTTVRANCASYAPDGNSCATCIPNFYLVSGACNAIPSTFANCNNFSGNACTLCNSGYMVNTLPVSGTCILPLDYINSSVNSPCSVMAPVASTITPVWTGTPSNTQTTLTCSTCNSYMYGYNPFPPEAICVNQSQLTFYSGFIAITQCKRYGLNYASTQAVVCMECNSGLFITGYHTLGFKTAPYQVTTNPTGITCTSTCNFSSASSAAVIPDDFFGFVNICVPATATPATVAAAAAGSLIQFPGSCQRYARYQYSVADYTEAAALANAGANVAAAQGSMMNRDYICFSPAPSATTTTTIPTNYLYLSDVVATVTYYQYEAVLLTGGRSSEPNPGTFSWDYTSGYANTVDLSSTVPTVFNYKGLSDRIALDLTQPTNGAAAALRNNNLSFCDIILRYTAAGTLKGMAYTTTASTTYTVLTAVDHHFACLRCQFGYQLSYTATGVIGNNPVFPSCTSMQNCASGTTVYGGLTTFLNSVFSCHLCGQTSGSSTFPTIWIETDASNQNSGVFVGWTVNTVYTSLSAVRSGHGFKCAAAPSSVLNAANAAVTVANCAAYGYITPLTTLGGAAAVATTEVAVCLACIANNYPIYAGQNNGGEQNTAVNFIAAASNIPAWSVVTCTPSLNCDTSVINTFNGCLKCDGSKENNNPPTYFGFQDYTLTNCFQATTQNCFILNTQNAAQSSQTNACGTCKAGYILNLDGVCESYRVPNQSITNVAFNQALFVKTIMGSGTTIPSLATLPTNVNRVQIRINYLLRYNQIQYGVTSCQSGWIQFPVNLWAPRICVFSSYIYNNTNGFPSTTQFINNCLRYNVTMVNNRNLCGGCNVGFIPTIDGSMCVSSTPLPNCVFAQSGANTALCFQCAVNFYNVNGQCINTPIANCAGYVNTQWSFITPSVLQCSTCLYGFVLSADSLSCSTGQVNNCLAYQQGQPTVCTKCAQGFSLMTLSNSVYYCYPFPAALNCLTLQSSSSTSGTNLDTISCALCNYSAVQVFGTRQWLPLGLVNQPQTLCMQFTPVSNCAVYDQSKARITLNTFRCIQCNTGYWYSATNQTCLLRSNNPSQCSSFSLTSDTCVQCSSGSFLNALATDCVPFPTGIFMCTQYSSASTCTQCAAGYYLSSNSCVQSTLIQNCIVYSANYTCTVCANGLYLFNSTSCISPSASNCLTFTSNTACASCFSGFGLQTTNGITSCVSNVLQNCINATSVAPFTCLVCNTGYFPNANGVCTVVSKAIINCLSYDTASTCTSCATGTVLNVPRTACNSTFYSGLIDPNCQQSFLTVSPNCVGCQLGSFFSNGTCVQCTNNTFASGCMSCDPTNVNVCLVCRPNFYMNAVGACISVNPTPATNNTPTTTNKTSTITKALALTLALVTLYFDQA